MAKKRGGGGKGYDRSAAAKKGWETRRRGGAASKTKPSKPSATAATTPTKASKPRSRPAGGTAAKGKGKPAPATTPKGRPATTTARGRARSNATEARKRLKAGGGSKAARSLYIAEKASSFYKNHGTGTKRSPARGGSGGSRPARETTSRSAAKPSRSKGGSRPAAETTGGRRPNLRAQQAKAMADRKGTIPGSRYESGQAQQTMSLREMRTAVRRHARETGVRTASEFKLMYGLASGLTTKGGNGLATGRMPKTRGDWETIYRSTIGVPQSGRGMKDRPGVIRGIDIHRDFRPSFVFGLKPGASAADVNAAFRGLARKNHPDVGGRRKDFERLKVMRDSLLAMLRSAPTPSKPRKSRGKSKSSSTPAPSGPKLLPGAGGTGKGASKKPRKSRKR